MKYLRKLGNTCVSNEGSESAYCDGLYHILVKEFYSKYVML